MFRRLAESSGAVVRIVVDDKPLDVHAPGDHFHFSIDEQ